ncbi:MAG: ABC transporter permease [Candidatus Humimicrobiaceae bacterium]
MNNINKNGRGLINNDFERNGNFFKNLFRGNVTFLNIFFFALFLFLIFSLLVPQFFTIKNMVNLSRQSSVNVIIAIGMTLLLICGEFDLSIPGTISLSAMLLAVMLKANIPIVLSIVTVLALSILVGFFNGYLSTKIPSFIATLGLLSITRGLSLFVTEGKAINALPKNFLLVGRIEIFKIPISWIYAMIILIVGIIVSRYTVFGRQLYALGGNRDAARSTGVPVNLRIMQTFMIMGFLAGIASIALVARIDAAHPLMSQDASLNAIAAVVIGGTSLFGGRGHVVGSLIGALIITMLSNVFTLMSFPTSLQGVILGMILIGVIYFDYLRVNIAKNR